MRKPQVRRPLDRKVRHCRSTATGRLWLNNSFAAVFVPQFQGTDSPLRLHDHIGVLRPCWPHDTQTRGRLGGPNLDSRTPTLRVESQQHSLSVVLTGWRYVPRQNVDACTDATVPVDYFERATSQNGGPTVSKCRMQVLRHRDEQNCHIDHRKCDKGSWTRHATTSDMEPDYACL